MNVKYNLFGVMLDCSRNAVMKPEEVKRFIDLLEKMGYNSLELYTEDTYKIPDEPYFGYMRGGYTPDEIKDIDIILPINESGEISFKAGKGIIIEGGEIRLDEDYIKGLIG